MTDKKFVDELIVKPPHSKAPDFVKCSISIKIQDMGKFLIAQHKAGEEWLNIDVKEAKSGKWYAEVNTWKPKKESAPEQPDFDDQIPF